MRFVQLAFSITAKLLRVVQIFEIVMAACVTVSQRTDEGTVNYHGLVNLVWQQDLALWQLGLS